MEIRYPVLSQDYEVHGFFDKDAQGWCSVRHTVTTTAQGTVSIRDWYDENGLIRADKTYQGQISKMSEQWLEIQLPTGVHSSTFYISDSGVCYYDRQRNRLLTETEAAQWK